MKWLKNNWLVVALGCVVAVAVWLQVSQGTIYDKLMEDYNAQTKANAAQIVAMEKVNEVWRAQRELLDTQYAERLENIQTEFNIELRKVSEERQKQRQTFVRAAKEDPTILTKELSKVFGIHIYKGKVQAQ